MNLDRIKATSRSLRFRLMLLNAIVVLLASMGTLVGLRAGMRFALVRELCALGLTVFVWLEVILITVVAAVRSA